MVAPSLSVSLQISLYSTDRGLVPPSQALLQGEKKTLTDSKKLFFSHVFNGKMKNEKEDSSYGKHSIRKEKNVPG